MYISTFLVEYRKRDSNSLQKVQQIYSPLMVKLFSIIMEHAMHAEHFSHITILCASRV